MPTEKEEVEVREQGAPEPSEPAPRGNVHSKPAEEDRPGDAPPPLPN